MKDNFNFKLEEIAAELKYNENLRQRVLEVYSDIIQYSYKVRDAFDDTWKFLAEIQSRLPGYSLQGHSLAPNYEEFPFLSYGGVPFRFACSLTLSNKEQKEILDDDEKKKEYCSFELKVEYREDPLEIGSERPNQEQANLRSKKEQLEKIARKLESPLPSECSPYFFETLEKTMRRFQTGLAGVRLRNQLKYAIAYAEHLLIPRLEMQRITVILREDWDEFTYVGVKHDKLRDFCKDAFLLAHDPEGDLRELKKKHKVRRVVKKDLLLDALEEIGEDEKKPEEGTIKRKKILEFD